MGAKWISRTLIESPYYIALCKTEKDFERELKRMNIPKNDRPEFITCGANATVHTFESGSGKISAIVCITKPKGVSTHQLNSLLVHEAVHIWQWIIKNIGETFPSKEFEAYSIQSISQGLMEAYWAKK